MRVLGRPVGGWAAPALSLLPTTIASFPPKATATAAAAAFIGSPRSQHMMHGLLGRRQRQYRSTSSRTSLRNHNSVMVNTLESTLDWSDRIGLQDRYTLEEKGWHVHVDWRPTPYGAGLFSKQAIAKGTILRTGILRVNLKEFQSIADIDEFCNQQQHQQQENDDENPENVIIARREYVKDYLWGFSRFADEGGYPLDAEADVADASGGRRFYGMWIPGNGLNHSPEPNTVYRLSPAGEGNNDAGGIDLVALTDIAVDDELFDDYRRHGKAPHWLKEFAQLYNVTLNFADCNDFVQQ